MMMKTKILLLLLTICTSFPIASDAYAYREMQGEKPHKFDPEKYSRDQEAFITKDAQLTQQEVAAFMPLFREMQQKQRALFKQHRQYSKTNPQNDHEATQLIKNIDNVEMQMKKIETQYHEKFFKVLSPIKVYKVHQAVNKFKHITMERVAKRKN
jgi:hypothetical protein